VFKTKCKNQNQILNQKSKTKMSSFLIALQTNVSRGNPKNYSSNTNGSEKKNVRKSTLPNSKIPQEVTKAKRSNATEKNRNRIKSDNPYK
jgi:hypothetical protein